jgi:putative ABC transport system substrate-binding protein
MVPSLVAMSRDAGTIQPSTPNRPRMTPQEASDRFDHARRPVGARRDDRTRRRRFISGIAATFGLLVAMAGPAVAQPAGPPHVAFLSIAFGRESPAFDVLRDELRALGQIEGSSFTLDVTVVQRSSELGAAATAIARAQPKVILALNSAAAVALHAATAAIPIVVVSSGDPVALGLSQSQSRPTSNVTGVEDGTALLSEKRLELLAELVPRARRIAFIYDSENINGRLILEATRKAAARRGIEVLPLATLTVEEVARVPDRAAGEGADAIIVAGSPLIVSHQRALIDRAIALRLPTIHAFGFEVEEGGLASYGTDTVENWMRSAQYVDRLLRGATIAELPFEPPGRVLLTLNLRTAGLLGLTIPPALLARADQVIE